MIPSVAVFAPEAAEQLAAIYRYIAANASPEVAERYTSAIISFCEGMQQFPQRGVRRDDIRPGLRITNYKKRVTIAFTIEPDRIVILGIFYAGRNYEDLLRPDQDG